MCTAEKYENYEIQGLLGKGLNLQKNGVHVAFTGGTGVLVFIDLVALLLRKNLGLIKNDHNIPIFKPGATFKFVLYVSFPNREDSVALELIEGLSEITKALKLKNFHLELRISNEGKSQRWDKNFIVRHIDIWKKQGLKMVYVCGPPVMNTVFDQTLESLVEKKVLRRSQIEIM